MDNQKILFPNDKAIVKYNIDKNGLYLNDEYGINEYSSPYLGVTWRSSGYHPTFNIPKHIEDKIKDHLKIRLAESKGFNHFRQKGHFPIVLKPYDDPRKAAYISQMLLFSDNNEDLILGLICHLYIEFDEEIDRLLNEFPIFEYKPIDNYDPKDTSYHISQERISEAEQRLNEKKQAIQKAKIISKNEKEFIERMKKYADKIGYMYDVMTIELAKKLMNIKYTNN